MRLNNQYQPYWLIGDHNLNSYMKSGKRYGMTGSIHFGIHQVKNIISWNSLLQSFCAAINGNISVCFLIKLHTESHSAFHSAVGGTASVLGGGKFADGAVTGSFTYLFNEAAGGRIGNRAELRAQRDQILDDLAAEIEALTPEQREFEWGGAAYLDGDHVESSGLLGGTHIDSNPELEAFLFDHFYDILGWVHNHPVSGNPTGADDRRTKNQINFDSRRNPELKDIPAVCKIWTEKHGVTDC